MRVKKDLILHENSYEIVATQRIIDRIVLHSMDGFFQSTIEYFKNPQTTVSSHYLISKGGEIVQMLKDSWTGYHAGGYEINKRSIGIELEDEGKRDTWIYPRKEIESLQWLVNSLCRKYNIPKDIDHILLHKNISADRADPVGNFKIRWVLG